VKIVTQATKESRRINVTFPADLLEALDQIVPPRKRNRFIVEATREALRQARLKRALEELRKEPAWTSENHPELLTAEDVDRYVRRLRESWMPRTWEQVGEETERDD
jgi:Txe/YoeB family toxin of Txe-Axe toxin-antitoxin module